MRSILFHVEQMKTADITKKNKEAVRRYMVEMKKEAIILRILNIYRNLADNQLELGK